MLFGKWKKQLEFNEKAEKRLASVDVALQNSFSNVRRDITHLQGWIQYLHSSQDRLYQGMNRVDSRMSDMDIKLAHMLTRDEIKQFVDEHYRSVDALKLNLKEIQTEMHGHIASIYTNQKSIFEKLSDFSRHRHEDVRNEVHSRISKEISSLKVSIEERMSSLADKKSVFDRLDELTGKIALLSSTNVSMLNETPATQIQPQQNQGSIAPVYTTQVQQEQRSPRQYLREKIFKKVTRHSKDYVKGMVISLIKKYGRISGLGLREIVVEEQGIVSKSSFYRILLEIEGAEEPISVMQDGKEKVYIFMSQAQQRLG